jgi:hypothetical protein
MKGSTMPERATKTLVVPDRPLGWFMRTVNMLLLIALTGGLLFAVPVSAQSTEQVLKPKTGSILGTVVDINNDPVPGSTIVLQPQSGNNETVISKEDGSFAFHDIVPGTSHRITITAEGFAQWSSSVTVEPGQEKMLGDVKLRLAAVQRAVTVGYSSTEVAKQQLKIEEQQRILSFIPNMYVIYDSHPEPLTARMKFHLAYKSLTDPTLFGFMAAWAGIQQGANTPDWPRNTRGYGERFGANLAGAATEGLFSNAILPSLLHQDPRYFYRGTGTTASRIRHAILAPFVSPGDNGHLQPNYSQWGGLLISGAIANTYYPASNRGAGLVFRNFGINMGIHVFVGVAQEFVLAKFTSKHQQ